MGDLRQGVMGVYKLISLQTIFRLRDDYRNNFEKFLADHKEFCKIWNAPNGFVSCKKKFSNNYFEFGYCSIHMNQLMLAEFWEILQEMHDLSNESPRFE